MGSRIVALMTAILTVLAVAIPAVAQQARHEKIPLSPVAPTGGQGTAIPLRLSLADTVTEALQANPGLKALSHQSAAAEQSAAAISRQRWGQLDAFFNYNRFNDDWIVRPMSRQIFDEAGGFGGLPWDRNQSHYGVAFQLPLYVGGKLSNGIEIAKLETQGAVALHEGTRRQVRFNATSLYSAAQTMDAVGAGLDELVGALEKTRERLDLMVELGKRPKLDYLKVVEQLEDAKAQGEAVRADRIRVGAMLLALLGRDPSGEIEVDPQQQHVPVFVMTPQAIRAAVGETWKVRQAHIAAEQSRRGVAVATASFLPAVVAEGNYMRNDAPSLDDPLDTWQVTVGLKVPLFHGAARFADLAAAKERQRAAEYGIEQAHLNVAAEVEDALAHFRSARAELVAARARVSAGDEAARIEQIRYDTGAGTIEDLLRAQARKESAKASLAKALGAAVTAAERINSTVEKEAVQ